MKLKKLRHIGIPCQHIQPVRALLEDVGFIAVDSGTENIHGDVISWVKMDNGKGMVIELLDSGHFHLAFEVDAVDPESYYFMAPSGHKIMWRQSPMPLELVEVPNG